MVSMSTVAAIAVVIVTIYTVNVESQENKANRENPPGDVVKTNPDGSKSMATGTEPEPTVNTVQKAKPPARKPGRRRKPTRRRQRKRRPRPGNVGRKNIKNKATVNIPDVKENPDLKPKAAAVKQPKNKPKPRGKPKMKKSVKGKKPKDADFYDPFLSMYQETTTAEPDVNQPPPEFSINVPSKKKVLPKLGPYKDAHDAPCNETFKPHNTSTMYMMKYADGSWETFHCPPNRGTGLVWRQDICSCGDELIPQDPDDWCGSLGFKPFPGNSNKYKRRDHGIDAPMFCPGNLIWSQKNCHCIYDPGMNKRQIDNAVEYRCKTILKLEFEGNLKDTAGGYQIKLVGPRRRNKSKRLRFTKAPGSTNKALMMVNQPLEFLAFSGNDFQTQVTYAISFKMSPRHLHYPRPMVLLTDECISYQRRQSKAREPSIAITFIPSTKTFRLRFKTDQIDIDRVINGALPDLHGWYKCVVYFEDSTLNLECGGKVLYSETGVKGKIPQNKCPLYIAGRGPGFDRSLDFSGYLDNIYLIKDCKFHQMNIKFL